MHESVPSLVLCSLRGLCKLNMQMNTVKSPNAITLEITSKKLAKVERKESTLSEQIKLLASICSLDAEAGSQLNASIETLLGCAKKTFQEKKDLEMLKELANGDATILENIKQTEKSLNQELFSFCSSINIICDTRGLKQFFTSSDAETVWTQVTSLFNEEQEVKVETTTTEKKEVVAPVKKPILATQA